MVTRKVETIYVADITLLLHGTESIVFVVLDLLNPKSSGLSFVLQTLSQWAWDRALQWGSDAGKAFVGPQ